MKKREKLLMLRGGSLFSAVVLTVALVLSLALFTGWFSIVSHAESAGRVTAANGANIRSSASASATILRSVENNATVSIRSQIVASDGYTWYEVWIDADSLGYIRSDLVEITDGSTPPSSSQVAPTNSDTSNNTGTESAGQVTAVNPISATVKSSNDVRVRSSASTSASSTIITTVGSGMALTVTGQTTGTDGKVWYQVSFISNNEEVSGFIRSDFVELSGELTPYVEPTEEPEPPADSGDGNEQIPEAPTVSETRKPYETTYYNEKWYLVLTETEDENNSYPIEQLLEQNKLIQDTQGTVKSQKIAIILLVILLVLALGAVALLIFKIKDMMDSAYFNEVENETLRRRNAQSGQRVMQSVGADKKPQNQRPAAGQRPAGAPQRPAGAGQRPAGAPQGQRPAGAPQGQKPSGGPQGQKPAGNAQGQKPAGASQGQKQGASQNKNTAKSQSKNFMSQDDDEFEFEFLNYDDEEEN